MSNQSLHLITSKPFAKVGNNPIIDKGKHTNWMPLWKVPFIGILASCTIAPFHPHPPHPLQCCERSGETWRKSEAPGRTEAGTATVSPRLPFSTPNWPAHSSIFTLREPTIATKQPQPLPFPTLGLRTTNSKTWVKTLKYLLCVCSLALSVNAIYTGLIYWANLQSNITVFFERCIAPCYESTASEQDMPV